MNPRSEQRMAALQHAAPEAEILGGEAKTAARPGR
jgi:hypothetical protein